MSETKTFAGLPVAGYGTAVQAVPQRPREDLEKSIRAVLAFESIEAVRWEQYTPYFNDGDPCVFSAGEVYFRLKGIDEGGDNEDGFLSTYDVEFSGGRHSEYDYKTRTYTDTGAVFPQHEAFDVAKAFTKEIGSGAHNNSLQELFGDHITVTVTREGISVDEYEHE
jgi:hypothetical protein